MKLYLNLTRLKRRVSLPFLSPIRAINICRALQLCPLKSSKLCFYLHKIKILLRKSLILVGSVHRQVKTKVITLVWLFYQPLSPLLAMYHPYFLSSVTGAFSQLVTTLFSMLMRSKTTFQWNRRIAEETEKMRKE
jgi:hypothetical protein